MDKNQKYREYLVQPVWQGITVFSMMLLFVCLEWLLKKIGIAADNANSPWILTTSLILFYTIFNSIISIKAESLLKYWSRSIMIFIALLVGGGFLAYLVSGVTIDEAGSFRWLYVVLTMGYLIFLAIVQSMKRIVDIAIQQDKRLRNEE